MLPKGNGIVSVPAGSCRRCADQVGSAAVPINRHRAVRQGAGEDVAGGVRGPAIGKQDQRVIRKIHAGPGSVEDFDVFLVAGSLDVFREEQVGGYGSNLEVFLRADVDVVVGRRVAGGGGGPTRGEAGVVRLAGIEPRRSVRLAWIGGALRGHAGRVVVVIDRIELVVVGGVLGQAVVGELPGGADVDDVAIAQRARGGISRALGRLGPGFARQLAHDHHVVALGVLRPVQVDGGGGSGSVRRGRLAKRIVDRVDGEIVHGGQNQVVIGPVVHGIIGIGAVVEPTGVIVIARIGELELALVGSPIHVTVVVRRIGAAVPGPARAVGGLAQAVVHGPTGSVGIDRVLELIQQFIAQVVGVDGGALMDQGRPAYRRAGFLGRAAAGVAERSFDVGAVARLDLEVIGRGRRQIAGGDGVPVVCGLPDRRIAPRAVVLQVLAVAGALDGIFRPGRIAVRIQRDVQRGLGGIAHDRGFRHRRQRPEIQFAAQRRAHGIRGIGPEVIMRVDRQAADALAELAGTRADLGLVVADRDPGAGLIDHTAVGDRIAAVGGHVAAQRGGCGPDGTGIRRRDRRGRGRFRQRLHAARG